MPNRLNLPTALESRAALLGPVRLHLPDELEVRRTSILRRFKGLQCIPKQLTPHLRIHYVYCTIRYVSYVLRHPQPCVKSIFCFFRRETKASK